MPSAKPYAEDLTLLLKNLHVEKPHAKPQTEKLYPKELHASRLTTILKQLLNKLPELLLYIFPKTQSVSKVMNLPEAIKPKKTKEKLRQEVKDETTSKMKNQVLNKLVRTTNLSI